MRWFQLQVSQRQINAGVVLSAHSPTASRFKLLLFVRSAEGRWEPVCQASTGHAADSQAFLCGLSTRQALDKHQGCHWYAAVPCHSFAARWSQRLSKVLEAIGSWVQPNAGDIASLAEGPWA